MKDTFSNGKTSLFEEPTSFKGPFSTMDISNLKQELNGQKHWYPIGLRTYSGIALEAFNAPNGKVVFPRLVPSRPTVRVPVILYPPWIDSEEPQDTSENNMTCLKRGYFCYKKTEVRVRKLCCFGFSIDLLRILERELGFIPEIYFADDGQYGTFDENTGKWSGIVNELVSGRGDLALDITLSEKRAKHIAFSFPYLPLALNVLVEKEGPSKTGVQWYSWLKPFDVSLWLTILGTCNVILLVIWWLDRKSPTGYYRILKETNEDGFTLLDAMSYVWGVAFSKDIGAEKAPRSVSARCVSTVYAFMALIIVNTYCANLMAFLVQDDFVLPINGITDPKLRDATLYPPDGFQLGILHGTFSEMYFRNHIDFEYRQIYTTNLKLNLMNNFTDGIIRLQNGEINGLVGDYLSLRRAANMIPNCKFCLAGPNFYTHGIGFAMPKTSPWLDEITRVVLEMKENGSISRLEKMYFNEQNCHSSIAKNLSILDFSGLFVTVAGTIGFCFLALLAEVVTIFVLVRFSQHLGALGKGSMRLLFDLKKGEEHLITLKYSTMRKKRNCVKWT
ncbi:hypothetical protein OS493_036895 [Desmophyllum pertusum]|uniref:Uncharacterized protein n=1 Tax=Desmophyllum pertusum TaxID=174260 RepID=A0A9W9YID5_9CNID|nr:hypothetical protein OS493_036895 [Desmophyllum pertusum]